MKRLKRDFVIAWETATKALERIAVLFLTCLITILQLAAAGVRAVRSWFEHGCPCQGEPAKDWLMPGQKAKLS